MRLQPSVLAALRGSVLGTSLLVGCGASPGASTTNGSAQVTHAHTSANTNAAETETTSNRATTMTTNEAIHTQTSVVTPVENIPPPCGRG